MARGEDLLPPNLGALGDSLDLAVAKRHLPNPALVDGSPNQHIYDSKAYLKALRSRLIDLGYLSEGFGKRNRRRFRVERAFVRAIKTFQQEAGLLPDGWAGPRTWQVMNCLVSFENDQEATNWALEHLDKADICENPAVHRAIYLRLYAMGFFQTWVGKKIHTKTDFDLKKNADYREALQQFKAFCIKLKLLPSVPEVNRVEAYSFEFTLINCLYKYDAFIDALARPELFTICKTKYRRQIEAIARIELWLQGYRSNPGADTFYIKVRRERGRSIKQSSMARAIADYWRDYSDRVEHAMEKQTVSAQLFQSFAFDVHDPTDDKDLASNIDDDLRNILADKKTKKTLEKQFDAISNGIWDGVKRVTRWLLRMIKRVIDYSVDFIANIARFISKKARKFFSYIAQTVNIVHSGFTYFKNAVFTSVSGNRMIIGKDGDFDHRVLIDPSLTPDQINSALSDYGFHTRVYCAATRILSRLIRMFSEVVRTIVSPLPWLSSLVALVRFAKNAYLIKNEIDVLNNIRAVQSAQSAMLRPQVA